MTLKTAKSELFHKTERGGVILGIGDEEQLRHMYQILSRRLGQDVLVAPMIAAGVDMILGIKRDPQFGPIVILGFGGVLAEKCGEPLQAFFEDRRG